MKLVILRVAATVLLLAGLVLAGAGAARAASPDPSETIGGRLSAASDEITVTNQGNSVARVTLTAEVVDVPSAPFIIAPGESHTVKFVGEPVGKVWANLAVVRPGENAGDSNSVVLGVTLRPYVAPFDFTPFALGLLILVALILVGRRAGIHRIRLTRVSG